MARVRRRSAIRTGAAKLVEGCAMAVVRGAGVVGGGTSTVVAGKLVVGAGRLEATSPPLPARRLPGPTRSRSLGAPPWRGPASPRSPEPPAANNGVPLAASRSSLRDAGESRTEPTRKLVLDAEVVGLACCRASGAAIRAWWTA